jgi:hypothetical protein
MHATSVDHPALLQAITFTSAPPGRDWLHQRSWPGASGDAQRMLRGIGGEVHAGA